MLFHVPKEETEVALDTANKAPSSSKGSEEEVIVRAREEGGIEAITEDSQNEADISVCESNDSHYSSEEDDKELDGDVCTACLGVFINFLEGNSVKNRKYIQQNVNHIFDDKVSATPFLILRIMKPYLKGGNPFFASS